MSQNKRQLKREEDLRAGAKISTKEEKNRQEKPTTKPVSSHYDKHMPQTLHCRKCKTLMENGVCPNCGFRVYVPMDSKKQNKINVVLTAVLMIVFVTIFVAIQLKKS